MSDIQQVIDAAEAQATEAHAEEELAAAGIVFREWCDFMADEPPAWDWIIPDIIAKGMKGDLNAKSKQWKSFFAMQLALCVSTGRPFLTLPASQPRRTAYFNLELIERGAWERGAAMGAALDAMPAKKMLHIVNLRGRADKLRGHTPELVAELRRFGIDFVVLDPRYKIIAENEDENSAAGLRGVLQFRDALAEVAAVLMVGHDPKGDTAGKDATDRGAGSYIGGADFDFSFALTPHEQEGCTVLTTLCRYRKPPPDLTICFDPQRQIFEADPDTPATVKQPRRGGCANADPKDKAERERLKLEALEKAVKTYAATHDLESMGTFRQNMRQTPEGAAFAQNPLRIAIDSLIEKGVIAKTAEKVRTERGEVRNKKNGNWLVGTPEKVAAYDKTFEELPL